VVGVTTILVLLAVAWLAYSYGVLVERDRQRTHEEKRPSVEAVLVAAGFEPYDQDDDDEFAADVLDDIDALPSTDER
jgi:hypothetical protein